MMEPTDGYTRWLALPFAYKAEYNYGVAVTAISASR
jgi:hypothetical protein